MKILDLSYLFIECYLQEKYCHWVFARRTASVCRSGYETLNETLNERLWMLCRYGFVNNSWAGDHISSLIRKENKGVKQYLTQSLWWSQSNYALLIDLKTRASSIASNLISRYENGDKIVVYFQLMFKYSSQLSDEFNDKTFDIRLEFTN